MSDVVTSPKTETRTAVQARDPLAALRGDMERMFQTFWRGAPLTGLDWPRTGSVGLAAPAIELLETEEAYRITAELPGLEKADVSLNLQDDNVLVLSGIKRSEIDEKRESVHISERSYGEFQRAISLPLDVETSKIEAEFENGLLLITLPRSSEKRVTQAIQVK
ncbi:MAG: Hsp20/alpha crystallin family protein [Alphaproteobacteria bacterium]|nr:Hsp20/alpha crystallin family protein [Alphaproteobacteria bacterium]